MHRFLDGDGLDRLQAELASARDLLAASAVRVGSLLGPVGPGARLREVAAWCDDRAFDVRWRWQRLLGGEHPDAGTLAPALPGLLLDLVRGVDWAALAERGGAWHDAWRRQVVGAHRRDGVIAARFIVAGLTAPSDRDEADLVLAADPALLAQRRSARERVARDWASLSVQQLRFDDGTTWTLPRYDHVAEYETEVGARLSAEDVARILDALPPRERAAALGALADWALHDLDVAALCDEERDLLRAALAPVRVELARELLPADGHAARTDAETAWRDVARAASEAMYVRRRTDVVDAVAWTFAGVVAGAAVDVPPEEGHGSRTALLVGQTLGGFVPVADLRDAAVHVRRGDVVGAGLSVAAVVPLAGDALGVGARTVRVTRRVSDVATVADAARTGVSHVRSRRVPAPSSPASDSGDLEGHPAGLQPSTQDRAERDRRRQHARTVR